MAASSSNLDAAPAAIDADAAPAGVTDAFATLCLSTNEREHPCWGCGTPAPPLDQKPFLQCTLCVAANYAVCCRFCGMECYTKHLKRHKKWHKKKDAQVERAAAQPDLSDLRQVAAEREAAAKDEYERLWHQAEKADFGGNPKAAVKLAKKAIELRPDEARAHFALANAYKASRDNLRASECYLSAMERLQPDSKNWAMAVFGAWDARRLAAPCGANTTFCDCERCAALPKKPAWMRSPEALLAMAERVVTANPESANAWNMHASAHVDIGDCSTASKSYMKAGKLFGDGGDAERKADSLDRARACLEYLRS